MDVERLSDRAITQKIGRYKRTTGARDERLRNTLVNPSPLQRINPASATSHRRAFLGNLMASAQVPVV
jgi:hypothetical protein